MPFPFPLQTRTLGRTGLQVTLAGLGCGGNSRLGLAYGQDLAHGASVVRAALDMGVTIIDTARYYQTEPAVGMALQDWSAGRANLVISSKAPYLDDERKLLTPDAFRQNLESDGLARAGGAGNQAMPVAHLRQQVDFGLGFGDNDWLRCAHGEIEGNGPAGTQGNSAAGGHGIVIN